ncbi:MAG TPA: ABC transporter permease [Acidimicrobiales bacterium]|nr:ABC transporter permease [Acidimicrobiales bacterium]
MNTAVAAPAAVDLVSSVQRGPAHWGRSYARMLRFDLATHRGELSQMFVMQLLMGLAVSIIYGLYVPHMPHLSAAYITTGAPTLALIPVGMVMVPAIVAQQRSMGTYDFVWSLPVPRSAATAATVTVFSAVGVPGMVATVVVAALRYHVHLAPSITLLPGVAAVAVMSSSVGFGLAQAVKNPMVTNLFANTLIFVATLFSPIAFPASHYPHWLVQVHQYLPLYPMATVVRDGLVPGLAPGLVHAYLVLALWAALAWAAVAWVVGRRR